MTKERQVSPLLGAGFGVKLTKSPQPFNSML